MPGPGMSDDRLLLWWGRESIFSALKTVAHFPKLYGALLCLSGFPFCSGGSTCPRIRQHHILYSPVPRFPTPHPGFSCWKQPEIFEFPCLSPYLSKKYIPAPHPSVRPSVRPSIGGSFGYVISTSTMGSDSVLLRSRVKGSTD